MPTTKLVDGVRTKAAEKTTVLDARIEQRFGLEIGRMEAVAGNEQRLVYFLPAGDGHVAAALVTSPANFQRWLPTLDAALHRIEGATTGLKRAHIRRNTGDPGPQRR